MPHRLAISVIVIVPQSKSAAVIGLHTSKYGMPFLASWALSAISKIQILISVLQDYPKCLPSHFFWHHITMDHLLSVLWKLQLTNTTVAPDQLQNLDKRCLLLLITVLQVKLCSGYGTHPWKIIVYDRTITENLETLWTLAYKFYIFSKYK